jgi:anti-anti-sigma regulatory factor
MPRTTFPVVVPYRLAGAGDAIPTVQVNAVAGDQAQATAIARRIAAHWLRLRHPEGSTVLADRIKVGTPSGQPSGPHLYFIGQVDIIHSLCFPTRIDSIPGEHLGEALLGLDEKRTDAVLFDCSELAFINTVGLTGLAAHVKRLRIHLIRVPESVQKVFDIVGLVRYLSLFPDLESALAAIPAPTPA